MPPAAPRTLRWGFLGRVPYRLGTEMQAAARKGLRRGTGEERLLLLEHPPVFTLGRNASRADVLADDAWLAERGVEIEDCDRGGQVTYHGPGQLVGYPILDLSPDRRDIRRYVGDLLETLVRVAEAFGVTARAVHESPRIGVWAGQRKLASVGVHISRWITTHGFALNVTTDLSMFGGIVACGIEGSPMTSIEALTGRRLALDAVAETYAGVFAELFGRRLVKLPAAPPEPVAEAERACPTAS